MDFKGTISVSLTSGRKKRAYTSPAARKSEREERDIHALTRKDWSLFIK
jgi:hypothetical protein